MYNWYTKIIQTLSVNAIEAVIDTIKVDCIHSVKEPALIFLFNLRYWINNCEFIHTSLLIATANLTVTYFWVSDV